LGGEAIPITNLLHWHYSTKWHCWKKILSSC